MMRALELAAGWVGLVSVVWAADLPEPAQVNPRVAAAASHPRLFWPAGGEAAVRGKIERDPRWKQAYEAVRLCADHMLGERPVQYRKQGRRLLGRSREALARVTHLSFVYRMTGDARYLERAAAEMKAAAAMPDWNPSHFLDTAEMTLALAIGYDWLYAKLPADVRATVREAIEQKGLAPYLEARTPPGWERGGNNWNQVCHAGMTAGALALLEDDPKRAAEVVSRALAGVPRAMKVYIPDGTYPEGPSYWSYGTTFNVLLIAMLESALDTSFGLAQAEGFLKTGEFMVHTKGPSMDWFDFSDCGPGGGFAPAMLWFAARTKRPEFLWFEGPLLDRETAAIRGSGGAEPADRFFPLALVWGEAGVERRPPAELNWYGRGPNPLAVFRTSWTDPNAVYLAIKAGSPGASHGHMDIGSFVLEADGVRWSQDLGSQSYHAMEARGLDIWNNRPGSDRWHIFRYHNRSHSTLMVDGQEQVVRSQAPIRSFSGDPRQAVAEVDMTDTYRGQLGGAVRRFTLLPERRIVVEDSLTGGERACTVRWAMMTPGVPKADGAGAAWLEKDGRRLRFEVTEPKGTAIRTYPADPPPNEFDEPNPGLRLVGFEAAVPAGKQVVLRVGLTPGGAASP